MKSIELSKRIRMHALKMHYTSQTSHIGSNFSVADILSVLYTYILKYDLYNERYEYRDRLIYSKGHASTILYSVLGEIGFIDKNILKDYGKNNQPLAGHITHKINGV